ncbi:GTP-binding protein Obg/CgtA [Thalictrum thalictroides]|uniref:GTP-binding protein Obg/CgtA n=1 Tax=Thalictrum thalictroides TaxID=46969 RepID=A0A7J6WQS5_THATH|nr:GTP-binding protein Obg/CgtA [Thalictrum thalictroides]
MEKHLDPTISGVSFGKEDHHPGCMWGILHVLRSYQWHYVKRVMPHKRRPGSRQRISGIRYSRLKSNVPGTCEAQGFIDSEMDDGIMPEMSESCPFNSRSCKIHMQTSEEMCKEQYDRSRISSIRSQFLRTASIHHLESSNHILPDEVREDGKWPTIDLHQDDVNTPESTRDPFLVKTPGLPVSGSNGCELCSATTSEKNLSHNQLDDLGRQLLDNALIRNTLERAKEAFKRHKSIDEKESPQNVALYHSKEVLDALEIFDVNNGLYKKTLHESSFALAHHFRALQASSAKKGLTKSVSFPAAGSFSRSKKTRKLKSMDREVGFFDDNTVSILKQDQESPDVGQTSTSSSPGKHLELKKRRFKDIKQRIKKAIKESRKEGHRISMDAIFHKMPYGSRFSKDAKREMADKWKESVIDRDKKNIPRSHHETNNSMPIHDKGRVNCIGRTQSLSQSLDRYSQLFELTFGRETKQHPSDNLKLASESGTSSLGSTTKSFGRILSLPELESYFSLQCDESAGALSSGMQTRNIEDSSTSCGSLNCTKHKTDMGVSTENHAQLDTNQGKLVEVGKISALNTHQVGLMLDPITNIIDTKEDMVSDLCNLTNREGCPMPELEQEARPANSSNYKQAQPSPISVLDSCFHENTSSPAELSVSEGPELHPKQIYVDEVDSSENLKDQSHMESFNGFISIADHENVDINRKYLDSTSHHVQVDKKDEADFNYVRDVLKLSGFSGNECLGTWYSPDQPVDPSLFEEVESYSPLKSDCSGEEADSSYEHQLLFEIINEVLLDIYDRSFSYWPKPLSCNCHIRPMPTGIHVLEEVWANISWYLNSQPEFEPLDYLVVRDLSKSDGWMNLQFDSECVGLELEEMILDDLLDELIYE